ncbi:MAG: hypothetical protein NTY15_03500 [Planctomycetota bacterium]|nr:hypothetical protein [Planctomycetota bacterium]
MKSIKTSLLAYCGLVGLFVGCTSFSSTPISRFDDNSYQGDSNGLLKIFDRARPYRGTPVKLKVQTHTDVWIDETYYLKNENGAWKELQLGSTFYSIRYADVMTEQIVIVDFKRPGSGTLDLKLQYDDKQYLKSVGSKLVDTTLEDSANLVGTIVKTFSATGAGDAKQKEPAPQIFPVTRTVAYQRFDINAIDYEQQLDCFVSEHLNRSNACIDPPNYGTRIGAVSPGHSRNR